MLTIDIPVNHHRPHERDSHPNEKALRVAASLVLQRTNRLIPENSDIAAAKKLLDDAGWVRVPTGSGQEDGKEARDRLLRRVSTDRRHPTLIASQLAPLGVKAKVITQTFLPGVFRRLEPGPERPGLQYPARQLRRRHARLHEQPGPDRSVPDVLLGGHPGCCAAPEGGNETRISIPAMDAAWETIVHTLDTTKIKDAYATVQDIYASDQNTFEVPFFNHVNVWLLNPKLHNMVGNPTTSEADWNTEDWWIERSS